MLARAAKAEIRRHKRPWPTQRIVAPMLRRIDAEICRHDVEIPDARAALANARRGLDGS